MMTKRQDLWTGGWWRFSSYRIQKVAEFLHKPRPDFTRMEIPFKPEAPAGTDELFITPCADAALEWYNPWEAYRMSKIDAGTPPPYQALLALLVSLGAVSDETCGIWRLEHDSALTMEEQQRLLNWCSRFGLLGILPHTAHRLQLPQRFIEGSESQLLLDREHVRSNGKWTPHSHAGWLNGPSSEGAYERFERLFTEEALPLGEFVRKDHEFYIEPLVFFQSSTPTSKFNGGVQLWKTVDQFFPTFVDDNLFECPIPLTTPFWQVYAERVDDFLMYALALLNSVEPLSHGRYGARPSSLEWLLEPVGVSLAFNSEGNIYEQWTCPSLLSSFGRMALQDLEAGVRLLRCECCGAPFATDRYQARYCSQACGWKYRKRRARTKPETQPQESPNV
jgi:hypothetical protein